MRILKPAKISTSDAVCPAGTSISNTSNTHSPKPSLADDELSPFCEENMKMVTITATTRIEDRMILIFCLMAGTSFYASYSICIGGRKIV